MWQANAWLRTTAGCLVGFSTLTLQSSAWQGICIRYRARDQPAGCRGFHITAAAAANAQPEPQRSFSFQQSFRGAPAGGEVPEPHKHQESMRVCNAADGVVPRSSCLLQALQSRSCTKSQLQSLLRNDGPIE
jgi:hypothetical protein